MNFARFAAIGSAFAVLAAPAAAAQKAIWGPATLPNGQPAFPIYHQLGVDTFQAEVDWSTVAPTKPADPTDPNDPAYKWPRLVDQAAAAAPGYGIKLTLLVTHAPRWANGNKNDEFAPTQVRDYTNFLTAVARRYPTVHIWMIWGEPNISFRFEPQGKAGARRYAVILDRAYGTLKRLSKRNIVVGGDTWTGNIPTSPVDWLKWMRLPNGKPPRLDWYGQNPYPVFPDRPPSLLEPLEPDGLRDISDMRVFSNEIQRVYHRVVPLWLSEYTIQSDRPSDVFDVFVSKASQARWLTDAYQLADQLGHRVAGLGWFSLLDQQPETSTSAHWGLMTTRYVHKPAFRAFELAPSVRLEPSIRVPPSVGPSRLRRSLRLSLHPKIRARFDVELRRGSRVLQRLSFTSGRPRSISLHWAGARHGAYTVVVRSSRSATERIPLRVT